MSANDENTKRGTSSRRQNRTIRALNAAKTYAERVASNTNATTSALTKKAVKAAYKADLPKEEHNALLKTLIAFVDAFTAIKETQSGTEEYSAPDRKEPPKPFRGRVRRVPLFPRAIRRRRLACRFRRRSSA